MDAGLLSKELSDRDKQFMTIWEKNPLPSAYISFLEPGARLQLKGHLPTTNKDTINSYIAGLDKTLIWETSGSGAAGSGDLGYTYGLLRIHNTPKMRKGHYARIWKKRSGDSWKIELEMMNLD
jgi:hypothetical protein